MIEGHPQALLKLSEVAHALKQPAQYSYYLGKYYTKLAQWQKAVSAYETAAALGYEPAKTQLTALSPNQIQDPDIAYQLGQYYERGDTLRDNKQLAWDYKQGSVYNTRQIKPTLSCLLLKPTSSAHFKSISPPFKWRIVRRQTSKAIPRITRSEEVALQHIHKMQEAIKTSESQFFIAEEATNASPSTDTPHPKE